MKLFLAFVIVLSNLNLHAEWTLGEQTVLANQFSNSDESKNMYEIKIMNGLSGSDFFLVTVRFKNLPSDEGTALMSDLIDANFYTARERANEVITYVPATRDAWFKFLRILSSLEEISTVDMNFLCFNSMATKIFSRSFWSPKFDDNVIDDEIDLQNWRLETGPIMLYITKRTKSGKIEAISFQGIPSAAFYMIFTVDLRDEDQAAQLKNKLIEEEFYTTQSDAHLNIRIHKSHFKRMYEFFDVLRSFDGIDAVNLQRMKNHNFIMMGFEGLIESPDITGMIMPDVWNISGTDYYFDPDTVD